MKIIIYEEFVMEISFYIVKFILQFYIKRKREREKCVFFFN